MTSSVPRFKKVAAPKYSDQEKQYCKDVSDYWNRFARMNGLASVNVLTDQRRQGILNRRKEQGFDLVKIFDLIKRSNFLLGKTSNWQVTFDFIFLSKNKWVKIMEGCYNPDHIETHKEKLTMSKDTLNTLFGNQAETIGELINGK